MIFEIVVFKILRASDKLTAHKWPAQCFGNSFKLPSYFGIEQLTLITWYTPIDAGYSLYRSMLQYLRFFGGKNMTFHPFIVIVFKPLCHKNTNYIFNFL